MRMLFALVALVGCTDGHDHDHDHDTDGSSPRSLETDGGAYLVQYVPDPDPIPFNEPFDVTFHVHDTATGDHVPDPIAPTFWMQGAGHDHGMNVDPVLTQVEDGVWTWEGALLHMTGSWDLSVIVDPDGAADEVVFEVLCCAAD